MTAKYNLDRAVYYPAHDYAAGWSVERVKLVLAGGAYAEPETINDAIEVYQCKLILEEHPSFFEEDDLLCFRSVLKNLFSQACALVSSFLDEDSIEVVFDALESQYDSKFWDFLASASLWNRITESGLRELLAKHPDCLYDVLQIPAMVKSFDKCLCEVLAATPSLSAELIIREFGVQGISQACINLPHSLSSKSIDEIMTAYLQSESPNLNYVNVLAKWPSSSKSQYSPSSDVIVLAKRRSEELNERLFGNSMVIIHEIGVQFSGEQRACKSAGFDGKSFVHTYGQDWLREYKDPGTILNNFIYVFEFMGPDGLLSIPAHKHDNGTIIETFTTRAFDEYLTSTKFYNRQGQALMVMRGYEEILEAEGTSIEHALDYVYKEYFPNQLGVSGFSVSLPAKGASWLDKCKAMGPEIERVLKAFILHCDKGDIDDAYFPYIDIKRFDEIASLIEEKYAIPGPSFEDAVLALFHDQSHLAFMQTKKSKRQEFYYHICHESVTRLDYYDFSRPLIDELVSDGFVKEDSDGLLRPTNRAHVLKELWDNGAIGLFRKGNQFKQVVAKLAEEDLVVYSDKLFSPDEAAYLNYMFNNARFSNALALRNKYDHADFSVKDSNAAEYQWDYYRLLLLLVLITLKINDELTFALGKGGIEDFVDWPLVDESLMRGISERLNGAD